LFTYCFGTKTHLKLSTDRWIFCLLLSLAPVELEGITKIRQAFKSLHLLQLCIIDLSNMGMRKRDKGEREIRRTAKEEETGKVWEA
jgi:hypothetical protein